MKSGRSIQDVSREILRQQEAKADYLVATDRLHIDTWGDSPVIRVLDREGIRSFKKTVNQYRAVIDNIKFKNQICRHYNNIECSQHQNTVIDLE